MVLFDDLRKECAGHLLKGFYLQQQAYIDLVSKMPRRNPKAIKTINFKLSDSRDKFASKMKELREADKCCCSVYPCATRTDLYSDQMKPNMKIVMCPLQAGYIGISAPTPLIPAASSRKSE